MPHHDRDTVLAAMQGRYADFYGQFTTLRGEGAERRGPCPLHQGTGPNLTVKVVSGLWFCQSQCQAGGDVFDFVQRLNGIDFPEALAYVADWAGVTGSEAPPRPRPPAPRPAPSPPPDTFLDPALARQAHEALLGLPEWLAWLHKHRGWTVETVRRFELGLITDPRHKVKRLTFPVYDAQGRVTNLRKHLFSYKADLTEERRRELGKSLPWEKGLRADLFPLSAIDAADDVLLVGGEPDAALACQMGFAAVTGTSGEGVWHPHYTEALRGKRRVTILYDNDEAGRKGAEKVAAALAGAVPDVRTASYPEGVKDLTEWVVVHGATRADVQGALDAAPVKPTASSDGWPRPGRSMFYGLAGEIVQTIEPHTEADAVALLVQLLAAFGSAIGRKAYFVAEADRHYGNLFAVLVGVSSKGRKGSSWGHIERLFGAVDPTWAGQCLASGLSSGEGVIWAVRDAITKEVTDKKTGETSTETVDAGIADKRLLVKESEFASLLRVLGRDGNTLSAIVRNAWDTGNLQALTKNSPARATGAHISIIGHVTKDELCRELSSTEAGNGFANRFQWLCVRRSKELPEGGNMNEQALAPFVLALRLAVEDAQKAAELRRDDEARTLWHASYHELSKGGPGLAGSVTSRGEAQVMRLAMLYALLERDTAIRRGHLEAALALWDYIEASARYVFGDSLGDPVADDILRALRNAKNGLSRNEVRDMLGRHQSSGRIGQALGLLLEHDLVRLEKQPTDGRPAERWFAVNESAGDTAR